MKDSKIEWTHHTFNPWWGCVEVSPACLHCYAKALAKRAGLDIWGPSKPRRFFPEGHWRQPLLWNRIARESGNRARVFCASMADLFEEYEGPTSQELAMHRARVMHRKDVILGGKKMLEEARARLFKLIHETPDLDWLLLTKRPENWRKVVESAHGWLGEYHAWLGRRTEYSSEEVLYKLPSALAWLSNWLGGHETPKNIWMGTTVEDQARAHERIPELLRIPAKVRFLSCEPLLGALHLGVATPCGYYCQEPGPEDEDEGMHIDHQFLVPGIRGGIDWVICGGESGPGARPMHPDWARSLRDQCQAARVSFFFKQWGEWAPVPHNQSRDEEPWSDVQYGEFHGAGEFIDSCLCVEGTTSVFRVGKKAAGRLLDGREWNEFPDSISPVAAGQP